MHSRAALRSLHRGVLLQVRKSAQPHVLPTLLDGGFAGYSQTTGTAPLATIAGLGYSVRLLASAGGVRAVSAYSNRLRDRLYDGLQALAKAHKGLRVLSPSRASGLASSLLSFQLPPTMPKSGEVSNALKAQGFEVKHLPDHEGGTPLVDNAIRFTTHVYNSEADCDKLLAALRAALGHSSAHAAHGGAAFWSTLEPKS